MLLEDLLLIAAVGIVGLALGWPLLRVLRAGAWRKRDPLAEAQERLRIAKLDAEVARVNRETEKIYEGLYDETLSGGDAAEGKRIAASEENARATENEERPPGEPTFEKGKRNVQE